MINSDAESIETAADRRRLSKAALIGLPASLFFASLLVAGAIGFAVYGGTGLAICLLVWAVVVSAAIAAHLIGTVFSSAEMFQSQLMIGIGIRAGVPLAFALFVVQFAKSWLDYGCVYYLFAFYFVGLAVDVFLITATFRPESLKAREKSAINSSAADVSH